MNIVWKSEKWWIIKLNRNDIKVIWVNLNVYIIFFEIVCKNLNIIIKVYVIKVFMF